MMMNGKTQGSARILVVDDDPGLLRLMQLRLEAAGYGVSAVDSGERALAQLAVSRPQAVVTDLQMGGMDGISLFEAIRAENPALPVIILTAHGTIPAAWRSAIITRNPAMEEVLAKAKLVAAGDASILI